MIYVRTYNRYLWLTVFDYTYGVDTHRTVQLSSEYVHSIVEYSELRREFWHYRKD